MVPIWQSTDSLFYLYVEQVMSASLEKSYRQLIYKVVKSSETDFVSYIQTIYNFQGEPIRKGNGQPGSGLE